MTRPGAVRRPIDVRRIVRRSLVTTGVIVSLVVGAITIQAAAAWTAASAPKNDPPVAMTTLQARLAEAQARTVALQEEIAAVSAGASDLADALAAVESTVGADTTTATQLRAKLEAARARLATLQKSLGAKGTGGGTVPGLTTAPPGATAAPPGAGATRPPGVPADWPADRAIPPMPSGCVDPQLEDNGVWNCQH